MALRYVRGFASFANSFQTVHWGTLYPRRLHRLWPGPLAEPGERFAGHAARLAPDVDVRVLRPGEGTSIVLPAARPDRS